MDMETIKFIFQVVQMLATAGLGLYFYITKKNIVTNERIGKLEADLDVKLDEHAERITRVEEKVANAPTHKDLGEIYNKVNEVSACVNRLEGQFESTNKTLGIIHQYLMERR